MSLPDRINADIKAAMKARDQQRLGVLRMLKSAIDYTAIEQKSDTLPDEAVIQVIQREGKKRNDSITQFTDAGRTESAAEETAELAILQEYLPTQLSPAALEALVREIIAETGATSRKDMGQVIKATVAKADVA